MIILLTSPGPILASPSFPVVAPIFWSACIHTIKMMIIVIMMMIKVIMLAGNFDHHCHGDLHRFQKFYPLPAVAQYQAQCGSDHPPASQMNMKIMSIIRMMSTVCQYHWWLLVRSIMMMTLMAQSDLNWRTVILKKAWAEWWLAFC